MTEPLSWSTVPNVCMTVHSAKPAKNGHAASHVRGSEGQPGGKKEHPGLMPGCLWSGGLHRA
jgi:hypothetical protein